MIRGIDCAGKLTSVTAAGIKAAGYEFAGRYLVPNSGSLAWKALTKSEAEAITGVGLRLLTVWETSADRVKGGTAAGNEDGARAYQVAKEINMPKNGVIYFAVDYDAQAADFRTIADYLRAARSQTGEYEIGVYGSYSVVEGMATLGICKGFWQCLAWSYGKKSSHLTVYQGEFNRTVAGVPVDGNECPDMDAAGIWTYSSQETKKTETYVAAAPKYSGYMIGHASIDERGKVNSGQAGDQTGKEVCVRSWYASGWNVVLRPRSAGVAEAMAQACEILCNGNLVGYDQYQRNTLWDELERVGWNPAKLTTLCETDCSAFMTACARCAGIDVPRVALGNGKYNAPVTSTMRNAFGSTGAFEILTDSKYLTSGDYLRRGDILVRESGHTAMALTTGVKAEPSVRPVEAVKEDDEMLTYEQWREYQERYRKELQDNDCGAWSEAARQWAISTGMINGVGNDADGNPNYAWADQLTREQAAALFYRFAQMFGKV